MFKMNKEDLLMESKLQKVFRVILSSAIGVGVFLTLHIWGLEHIRLYKDFWEIAFIGMVFIILYGGYKIMTYQE